MYQVIMNNVINKAVAQGLYEFFIPFAWHNLVAQAPSGGFVALWARLSANAGLDWRLRYW
ncbi:hypothetical protein GCM10007082_24570 [Oceanisphaera arctica]|nr:hypothetical protein GCM10007082_24570 [Oceanisphaera arctica]